MRTKLEEGVGHFYYGIEGASGEQRRLELAKLLYEGGLALMSSVRKFKVMIVFALFLILPFALLEVYVVVRFGFSEPYSHWFSVPMGVASFFLLQFAIGYGVVKGWADCKMPDNYYLLGLWVTCLLVLFLLPKLFPDSPIS